jgi:hypothetical protein
LLQQPAPIWKKNEQRTLFPEFPIRKKLKSMGKSPNLRVFKKKWRIKSHFHETVLTVKPRGRAMASVIA